LFALLPILLLSTFACGGGGEEEATPTPIAGYLIHTDEANGFAISYPEDWDTITTGVALIAFVAEADPICAPQFSVTIEELSQPMSVETWFEELKDNLTAAEGYTPISEEEMTVDGIAAIKHVCSFDVREVTFQAMLLYAVEGTTGWTVFCTCRFDCWSQYGPIFDTVAGSFRLLE